MAATSPADLRRIRSDRAESKDAAFLLPRLGHGWQASAGFVAGGLVTAVLMLGSAALSTVAWWEVVGRFGGFALGGAIGGAALAWGLPGKRGWRHGAMGFALGMLAPAFLAGSAVAEIISFQRDRDITAIGLAAFIAFSTGYGIGGALGMSFVWPKLFWTAGWRFFFAGGLGGLICAGGAALAGDPRTLTAERAMLTTAVVLLGHLTPFALGGWLAGRAVDAELNPAPQRRRRSR